MIGRLARWMAVRSLAWAMKSTSPAGVNLTEVREAFDRSQKHRSEEWRRDVWREAAQRAAKPWAKP